jgi:6-phosphofructokinase
MTEPTRVRDLTISDADWMNGGPDINHLTTILVINGTFHHLEAIRVVEDEDGRQHAASPDFEDSIDAMFTIGGDGPFDTVTIRGETYVLVVIPFQ